MNVSRIIAFCLVAVAATASPLAALAEITEHGIGLAYGKDHAYFLTAPKGWMLDTESAAAQHVYATFYPKGSSWDQGEAVMYSNAAGRENRTLEQAITADYNSLKAKSPKLALEDGGTETTADSKTATIRYYKGDNYGNYEAVGYVLEPKVVVNIVLTARNKSSFDSSLPAFKQLVASYKFVTDTPEKVDLHDLVKQEHDKRGEQRH